MSVKNLPLSASIKYEKTGFAEISPGSGSVYKISETFLRRSS
jgi:hypothetical protein